VPYGRSPDAPPSDIMSAGCAGEVGGDDIGGVAVERNSGSVVAHRGSRIGVRGRFLHVT